MFCNCYNYMEMRVKWTADFTLHIINATPALYCISQCTSIRCISENAFFIQFFVILPDIPSFIQPALNVIRNHWWSSSSRYQSQASFKILFWYIKHYGYYETNVAIEHLLENFSYVQCICCEWQQLKAWNPSLHNSFSHDEIGPLWSSQMRCHLLQLSKLRLHSFWQFLGTGRGGTEE